MRDDSRFINTGISEFTMNLHDRSVFRLVDGSLSEFVYGQDDAQFIHEGGVCTSQFSKEDNFTITRALDHVESSAEDEMSQEEDISSEDDHDSYGQGHLAPNILGETDDDID